MVTCGVAGVRSTADCVECVCGGFRLSARSGNEVAAAAAAAIVAIRGVAQRRTTSSSSLLLARGRARARVIWARIAHTHTQQSTTHYAGNVLLCVVCVTSSQAQLAALRAAAAAISRMQRRRRSRR